MPFAQDFNPPLAARGEARRICGGGVTGRARRAPGLMGEHHVEESSDAGRLRSFMRALLDDLRALEQMLDAGRVEAGVRRGGAWQ